MGSLKSIFQEISPEIFEEDDGEIMLSKVATSLRRSEDEWKEDLARLITKDHFPLLIEMS